MEEFVVKKTFLIAAWGALVRSSCSIFVKEEYFCKPLPLKIGFYTSSNIKFYNKTCVGFPSSLHFLVDQIPSVNCGRNRSVSKKRTIFYTMRASLGQSVNSFSVRYNSFINCCMYVRMANWAYIPIYITYKPSYSCIQCWFGLGQS